MFMDNAFECIRDDLRGDDYQIELNCVAANEHEPYIERCIRHIKERSRCTFAAINFKWIPRRLVAELVCTMVYWINSSPRQDGVHPTLSPRAIMTGQSLAVKNTEFQFGDFVQATEPPKTNATGNIMDARVSNAIYCRPSGNKQGGLWVYKLSTAQVVHRNKAKLAHSSDAIATQVEKIAEEEGMPLRISFGDRDGGTTILDFETDDNSNDGISNGEYSNGESQSDDDHILSDDEYVTAEEDKAESSDDDDKM